jgi:hypothetical protein
MPEILVDDFSRHLVAFVKVGSDEPIFTGEEGAAAAGASTRELMYRMGHGSMRTALIYQHATSERDNEIADKLSERVKQSQSHDVIKRHDSGAARRWVAPLLTCKGSRERVTGIEPA